MAFLPEPLTDDLPGALCLAFGLMMLIEAVRRAIAAHAAPLPIGPDRTLALVRRLRLVLVGGALSGAGIGLLTDLPWLVTLSLIIGGQELLESSVFAAALRDESGRRRAEARLAAEKDAAVTGSAAVTGDVAVAANVAARSF